MVRKPLIIALGLTLGLTLVLTIFLQVTNQFFWFLGQPAASVLPPFEWKPSPSFPSDEVRCLIFHFDNSSGARRALYIADYGGSPSIHHEGLTVFQEGKRERRVSVTPEIHAKLFGDEMDLTEAWALVQKQVAGSDLHLEFLSRISPPTLLEKSTVRLQTLFPEGDWESHRKFFPSGGFTRLLIVSDHSGKELFRIPTGEVLVDY